MSAIQMAVTAVLFVRPGGERNATTTTCLFENSYPAHYPRPVAVRFYPERCLVSREWSETPTWLDTSPDPTAGQAHHQLVEVERLSKLKHFRRKKLMKSIHNSLGNKLCYVSQAYTMSSSGSKDTVRSGGRLHRSNHERTKPKKHNGRSERVFAITSASRYLEA